MRNKSVSCAMSYIRKKGKTVHSEAREVKANVIKVCYEESESKNLTLPLNRSTDRAAHYTGVSPSLIKSIRRQSKERAQAGSSSPLHIPGKHRPRPSERNVDTDDFDLCVRPIRRTVQEFYKEKKNSSNLFIIIASHHKKNPWCGETLRKVLQRINFKWKCRSKHKILIERPDIVTWRSRYLTAINRLRNERKLVFYLEETWVDSNLTFRKCWQSDDGFGVCADGN